MIFLINECSLVGQADDYSASQIISILSDTISAIQPMLCADPVLIHSNLANRYITRETTLHAFLQSRPDSLSQQRRVFLIALLSKGPYVEELLHEIWHYCEHNYSDVTGTSIAGAACLKGVLISFIECPLFAGDPIVVVLQLEEGTSGETVQIRNMTTPESVRTLRRVYVPSDKHDRHIGWGTRSTLSAEQAQALLDCGISSDNFKQVYAYYQGTYYEFQPDNAGGYHGYPVIESEIPQSIIKTLRGSK